MLCDIRAEIIIHWEKNHELYKEKQSYCLKERLLDLPGLHREALEEESIPSSKILSEGSEAQRAQTSVAASWRPHPLHSIDRGFCGPAEPDLGRHWEGLRCV